MDCQYLPQHETRVSFEPDDKAEVHVVASRIATMSCGLYSLRNVVELSSGSKVGNPADPWAYRTGQGLVNEMITLSFEGSFDGRQGLQ